MGTFTYKATVVHIFHHTEDVIVTFEANSEHEADDMARDEVIYITESSRSSFQSEHEESNVEELQLIDHVSSDDDVQITPRCDQTIDMFDMQEN